MILLGPQPDERQGDQVMFKVINIDGNKIRLSRKAVLREQRQKQQPSSS